MKNIKLEEIEKLYGKDYGEKDVKKVIDWLEKNGFESLSETLKYIIKKNMKNENIADGII